MTKDEAVERESGSDSKGINLGGGSNQRRVRDYNERLVLSLIQREGTLSRAEIARRSGLSAQTVTIIARALERDRLLRSGEVLRGRVGQPSIPLALNPDGAFSFGLKIGRRSADLLLMDFSGNIRLQRHVTYAYPLPDHVLEFAATGVAAMTGTLPVRQRKRIAGIGVAMPFELWRWPQQLGVQQSQMDGWRDFDMVAAVSRATGLPTVLENDATAACEAEFALGKGREYTSFVYFFIGFFIGGGIVLNHAVYPGPTGNAGALGAMPVGAGPSGYVSLIDRASIHLLENAMLAQGMEPSRLWLDPDGWTGLGEVLDRWIEETAANIAIAIVAACAVIDFDAAIIDGGFPGGIRDRIARSTAAALASAAPRGISPVSVQAGTQGFNARAIGAARLPIAARFLMKRSVLFKEPGVF